MHLISELRKDDSNIIITGYPSSGKTLLAQQLNYDDKYYHIDENDVEHLALMKWHMLYGDQILKKNEQLYLNVILPEITKNMRDIISRNKSKPVIITGSFITELFYAKQQNISFTALLQKELKLSQVKTVWLDMSDNIMWNNMNKNLHEFNQERLDNWSWWLKFLPLPADPIEVHYHLPAVIQ